MCVSRITSYILVILLLFTIEREPLENLFIPQFSHTRAPISNFPMPTHFLNRMHVDLLDVPKIRMLPMIHLHEEKARDQFVRYHRRPIHRELILL